MARKSVPKQEQQTFVYNLEVLLDDDFKKLKQPEKVEKITCYILELNGKTNAGSAFTAKQIIEKYKELKKLHNDLADIQDNSFTTNISLLAGSSASKIFRAPKQGYYMRIDEDSEFDEIKEFKEKDLYPLLIQWLSLRCERVQDISSSRGMKTWGNPDVVGIDYDVFFNNIVDVTTIEAKKDKRLWRIDIFEAIAHSTFANKAYYAYMCKESDKTDEDMLLYAQKFGIGILKIAIPDKKWGKDMKLCTEYISEIVPAPDHNVILKFQKAFLNGLKIYDIKGLSTFGKTNQELTSK